MKTSKSDDRRETMVPLLVSGFYDDEKAFCKEMFPRLKGEYIRKKLVITVLSVPGQKNIFAVKKHFPRKHENIDFYTNLRSVEVGTHPLTSKEYFRGQKTCFKYESGNATFVTFLRLSDDLSYIF